MRAMPQEIVVSTRCTHHGRQQPKHASNATKSIMCKDEKREEKTTSAKVSVEELDSQAAVEDEGSARTQIRTTVKAVCARDTVLAFWRSLWEVDYTQLALVPGTRTALLLILEWSLLGIGNPTSTAFQLGCLYVGLSDQSGNATRRLRGMGLTLVAVMVVGTLLPGLIWDLHPSVTVVVAFLVAFLAGLAPLSREPSLFLAMKLGTALFAINGAVNRNTDGYGGLSNSLLWTLAGSSASLSFALLPEAIGTRDAVRTDLFKVYHGFGMYLNRFAAFFGTLRHVENYPMPRVTMSITKTQDFIYHDGTEDEYAREWLLEIMDKADALRTTAFCLSHLYAMTKSRRRQRIQHSGVSADQIHDSSEDFRHPPGSDSEYNDDDEEEKEIHALFLALGQACRGIALAFQFPWVFRHSPLVRRHLEVGAPISVKQAATALKAKSISRAVKRGQSLSSNANDMSWLPPLTDLLEREVLKATRLALNITAQGEDMYLDHSGSFDYGNEPQQLGWPPYSSICSLPRRLTAAFPSPPSKIFDLRKDPGWVTRNYALRFGLAFSLASLPDIFLEGTSGHWFPMTVALIMGPTGAATLDKIAHRTIGTLLGIGLGSALSPLFSVPPVLILLLGLNTYAVCVLLQASYVGFTFFVTAWVFCTTVGTGAKVGVTVFFRVMWTLAAALLVVLVIYVYPPTTKYDVPKKLVLMAQAIKVYAQAVRDEHFLLRSFNNSEISEDTGSCTTFNKAPDVTDGAAVSLLDEAHERTKLARKVVIETRVALMTSMNEAILTPVDASSLFLDPHSVVPAIASDLMDVAIIPQYLSLMKGDRSVDDIVSTLDDEEPYEQIDRLVARLEKQTTRKDEPLPSPRSPGDRSAFSIAVACAHSRLDGAGVPG